MNVENSTADRLGIQPESDVHGESGSVQVSFPSFIYPQAGTYTSLHPVPVLDTVGVAC